MMLRFLCNLGQVLLIAESVLIIEGHFLWIMVQFLLKLGQVL